MNPDPNLERLQTWFEARGQENQRVAPPFEGMWLHAIHQSKRIHPPRHGWRWVALGSSFLALIWMVLWRPEPSLKEMPVADPQTENARGDLDAYPTAFLMSYPGRQRLSTVPTLGSDETEDSDFWPGVPDTNSSTYGR